MAPVKKLLGVGSGAGAISSPHRADTGEYLQRRMIEQ
jgi:hypothetical protein